MIKHNRGPEPPFFREDVILRAKHSDDLFYEQEQNIRAQKRSHTQEENLITEHRIETILRDEFNGKCAFCEQQVDRKNLYPLNHRLRPRRSAKNLNGEVAPDHYYWYTYEWKNLYLICNECNEHKSTFFPVKSFRADSNIEIEQVDRVEERLFIDPCTEDPEEHFYYEDDGSIQSRTRIGQVTIELFQLNRISLKNRRKVLVKKLLSSNSITSISSMNLNEEFIGLKRFFLRKKISENPYLAADLTEVISTKDKDPSLGEKIFVDVVEKFKQQEELQHKKSDSPKIPKETFPKIDRTVEFVQLHSLEITNFKNITNLRFEFPQDTSKGTSWAFFLGENGSGKSSIIQAVTLALIGESARKKLNLNPKEFLQRGKRKCTVKLETSQGIYNLVIRSNSIEGTNEATTTFVIAYGSTRLMATTRGIKEQNHKYRIKVGNLFDPTLGLVNAEKWLLSLKNKTGKTDDKKIKDEATFNLVSVVIKEVLGLTKKQKEKDDEGNIIEKNGEIWFIEPGRPDMVLSTLSDGYKVLIALVCDICRTINEVLTKKNVMHSDFQDVQGIIIIDELGTHLHPRWKMRIVKALRRAFKKMRFIVTSHEPLCLRGIQDGEAIVVEYEDSDVTIIDDLPDPSKFRIDQILTSPFFGLYSVVDPEESETFYKYYELLRKQEDANLSSEDKEKLGAELKSLSEKVKQYNLMGNTLREELAYYAVDQLLANQKEKNKIDWNDLKERTKNHVNDLWKEYEDEIKE
ncbi:AAA family ATPase [Winogradskyella sp.]|uniref:AAA family ATPase n=1 Tax=Winogradskyella sp. TaxID=1883156 RepID=UPI003BAD09EF